MSKNDVLDVKGERLIPKRNPYSAWEKQVVSRCVTIGRNAAEGNINHFKVGRRGLAPFPEKGEHLQSP